MTDFNTDRSVILQPRYIVDVARRMQKKKLCLYVIMSKRKKTVIISKKATKNTKTNIFEKFPLKNLFISNLMLTFVVQNNILLKNQQLTVF